MEAVPSNIKEIIDDLAQNEKPLLHADLADLSNLSAEELIYLSQIWANIEADRRSKIIARLVELTEENFELNFDSIFKVGLKDADPGVKTQSIEGLWENEETSLITPLIKMLNEDPSEEVQAASAKALAKYAMLAELKKLGPYSSGRVSQALLAILADKNKPPEVWRRALEAAAPLTMPEIKKAITDGYQSSDPKIKNSAIFAMGKNCDASWLPTIIKELSSLRADTRYEAAGACGELCDEEAVPHIIRLTADTDVDVQRAAIAALGSIGGNKAKQYLLKLSKSTDEIVSEAADQALKQIVAEQDSFTL